MEGGAGKEKLAQEHAKREAQKAADAILQEGGSYNSEYWNTYWGTYWSSYNNYESEVR